MCNYAKLKNHMMKFGKKISLEFWHRWKKLRDVLKLIDWRDRNHEKKFLNEFTLEIQISTKKIFVSRTGGKNGEKLLPISRLKLKFENY